MAAITIRDLPTNHSLDRQSLAALRGGMGEGHWVFGWMQAFVPPSPSLMPVVNNFVQTNNFIGQIVNQSQTIAISNSGAGANVTAVLIGGLAG